MNGPDQKLPAKTWRRALCPSCYHQLQTCQFTGTDQLESKKISLEVEGEDGETVAVHEKVELHAYFEHYMFPSEMATKEEKDAEDANDVERERLVGMASNDIQVLYRNVKNGGTAHEAAVELGVTDAQLSRRLTKWKKQIIALKKGEKLPASKTVLTRNTEKLRGGLFDALWFPTAPKGPSQPFARL